MDSADQCSFLDPFALSMRTLAATLKKTKLSHQLRKAPFFTEPVAAA
jgi:hypothetical protein